MIDNIRRTKALRTSLARCFCFAHSRRLQRHFATLVQLGSAIAAGSVVHLPRLAMRIHDRAHPESRIKRLSRWLKNPRSRPACFYAPLAQHLARQLSRRQPLVLVIDASAVARGCAVLMVSALYQRRALPLSWLTRRGSKGAFSTQDHLRLFEQLAPLVPADAAVVVLGDGEFDAPALQRALAQRGWHYVLRTSRRTWIDDGFTCCQAGELVVSQPEAASEAASEAAILVVPGASVTASRYGPVQVVAWHEAGHRHGLCLVTNLELGQEAVRWYRRRFQVETLFSDQKRRGFGLERSHVSDPARVDALLIAVSLAYVWLVCLGAEALTEHWYRHFARGDRVDLGLFQLGRRALAYRLSQGRTWASSLSPPRLPLLESVR